MANLKFKMGLLQNLPTELSEGTVYVTTDEHAVYLDISDQERIQLYDYAAHSSALLDIVYPIGSIYLSINNVNPNILLGGTWEAISDVFLLGAGGNYEVNSTGGEVDHVLTVSEMPSHNHMLKTDINNPTYNVTWPEWFEYTDGWTQQAGETQAPATHTTRTGDGEAHNNMPPYLAVYMWKRIG